MNVKSVEKENGKAKIVVEIDKDLFESGLNKAYQKNKKHIMVPGFRKGKAPRKVIEGMYGATVFYEDAINEIFPDVYAKAIEENELKVVGMPSVLDMDVQDGAVTLTVETELYPEVKLGQYKGLEVPKAEIKITDEEVEAELKRMAERNARISTVERAAAMGDTVILDFEGFDKGVAFEGGKAEKFSLKLGSRTFVPGFEEALVGLSAGDEKDIDVTFPANYAAELAGKPVVFKCKIHEVKESILAEIDDEFAKDVSEFDTLDALKDDIRARFQKSREDAVAQEFENNAVTRAANNIECNIPECMIDEQIDKQMEQFTYQLQASGMKMEDYAKMLGGDMSGLRQNMRPMALNTVKTGLLLTKVVEEEKIEVTEEELDEGFKQLAEQYQMELEKVKELLAPDTIKAELQTKKAIALIVESAVPVAPAAAEEKKAPKKKTTKKKAADEAPAAENAEEAPAPKKRATKKKVEAEEAEAKSEE